jgi:hypothetical protein
MIADMVSDTFAGLDAVLGSGEDSGALDYLMAEFRKEKEYHLVFEARLMKKRMELGLPAIQTQDSSLLPAETRSVYEQAMMEAARETGDLYLADGNIPRAWPYFRAIGETGPIAEAIERAKPVDDLDAVIAIAMQEGVNPYRGLELILENQGMCRAITTFGMFAVQKERGRCIALLARSLHSEIVERMTRAIESVEKAEPRSQNLCELIEGRDWLFGEFDYYVDTSHLVSILPYCLEVTEEETLQLFREMCAYGKRLGANFQTKGQPPFENTYVDYGEYIEAALGVDVEARLAHFRKIAEEVDLDYVGNGPVHFLIKLLVRFGRLEEALEISLTRLEGAGADDCPSALQICRIAENYERLRELAKARGDVLTYAGATIDQRSAVRLAGSDRVGVYESSICAAPDTGDAGA